MGEAVAVSDSMTDKNQDFWKISTGSLLILVAIFGPLFASYGIYIRQYFGLHVNEESDRVLAMAALGSFAVAVAFFIVASLRRAIKRRVRASADREVKDDRSGI